MQRAKAYGVDAFTLSMSKSEPVCAHADSAAEIGTGDFTDTYQSAAANGMKVFISFDLT
jgi:hypothetical protein